MARQTPNEKGRTWSSSVPIGLNKSGVFIGGSTGSGTAKAPEKKPLPTTQRTIGMIRGKGATGLTGPSGSGTPQAEWVGKGTNKRYADVPEANKDRGKISTPKSFTQQKRDEAKSGVDMGGSRQTSSRGGGSSAGTGSAGRAGVGGTTASTPSGSNKSGDKPKKDVQTQSSSGSAASSQGSGASTNRADSGKNSKELPAPGTLNYFMRRSAKMGDKNVSNRAYQMWKNYKKALKEGKKPPLPPLEG